MHNPEHKTIDPEGSIVYDTSDGVIATNWPEVLMRFNVSTSVERLIRKKELELGPDELAYFMDAAVRRLEELSDYED